MRNSNFDGNQKNTNLLLKVLWWLFLFPIALTVYIAQNKKMNNVTKGVLIALFWIIFLTVGFSNSSSNKNKTKNNTATNQSETSVKIEEPGQPDENNDEKYVI